MAGHKVIVCDYPDGRLEIMHESFALPYRTFDTLRSVHRAEVVDNKRLDDMLSLVAEMQAVGIYSEANVVRDEPDKRTVCSRFQMAARQTAIRSGAASRGEERIS